MDEYPYNLDKSSKKHHCPKCTKKRFVRSQTGEHLPEQYGRCDREINCGYQLNPYTDGYAKMIWEQERGHRGNGNHSGNRKPTTPTTLQKPKAKRPTEKPVSFIPFEKFRESRKGYDQNNFVQWLTTLFDMDTTSKLISRYHIGTSKHWNGATVFWQIDQQGRIRSGKIMLYNTATGKRVKEPCNHITWAHKALKMPDFNLQQCLFGEHLLRGDNNPVALVESDKTAIVASVYLPQFLWLAVGSLSNLNFQKCRVLAGREVYLFPDLNAYEKWKTKAKELSQQIPGTRFEVSDLLERKATETERSKGLDLADYLIKNDWQKFRKQPIQEKPKNERLPILAPQKRLANVSIQKRRNLSKLDIEKSGNLVKLSIQDLTKLNIRESRNLRKPHIQGRNNLKKPEIQESSITELETLFARTTLPTHPVKLNQCTTITDVSKFINSHLNTLKVNGNKEAFLPYMNRLQELKQAINDKYQMI